MTEEEEDKEFQRKYSEVCQRLGYEHIARVLSGRLRQMDKRAKAANQRADSLQREIEMLKAKGE